MEVLRAIGRVFDHFAPPAPSDEWNDFFKQVRAGQCDDLPVFGHGERISMDYFGMIQKTGTENARLRVPLMTGENEVSYIIRRHADGTMEVLKEGILPNSE